ncbi:MAG: DUF2254 domain-containing protein [Gammaproteobacteria bacterium]|nr:DUF2254 domain-containing protein [Gammaproteobacteria bacterium]
MYKLRQLWSELRSSFWLIPSLMVTLSIAFAVVLIEIDSTRSDLWLSQWPRLFGVGPEGARQMLSTLAGSMMSVMGITFSMTLVALALASSQYTSRILWNFMRSRITQITLGGFSGIFAYCLVVLRTIRGGNGSVEFVPDLAVIFAFILAILSIGVLVFFIHHIAASIQASSIIALIANETTATIDRFLPEKQEEGFDETGEDENRQILSSPDKRTWYAVPAKESGYIQNVDYDALLSLARDRKTIVRIEHGIGAFVVENAALASLALTYPPDQATINAFNAPYSIGHHRTVEQDPAFGIREIVDMALKALSPGVNDTSTAIMSIDYLTSILARLICQRFPPAYRYEGETLRMIAIVPTFESLLADAFDQIRGSAGGNFGIMARMLDALETLSSLTTSPCRRQALYEQVQWIAELADRTIESTHDRARIEQRLTKAREAIDIEPGVKAL